MQQIKRLLVLIVATGAVSGLVAVPALARNGADDPAVGTATNTTTTTEPSSGGVTSAAVAPIRTEIEVHDLAAVNAEVKTSIKTEVETEVEVESHKTIEDLKKTEKEHTKEDRQKSCTVAEHGLETKIASLSKNATAFQVRVDNALTMAIAFQKDNNLTISNFDTLLSAAEAARTQAASSVSVLSALNTNLDCTQPDVAQKIAEFKIAAGKARTDLKAYKTAVKAILAALEVAKGVN